MHCLLCAEPPIPESPGGRLCAKHTATTTAVGRELAGLAASAAGVYVAHKAPVLFEAGRRIFEAVKRGQAAAQGGER